MKKAGLVVACVGLIMAVLSFQDTIAAIRPWVDLYAQDTNVSEISSWSMVDAEVIDVFGSFASKTTTENGRKTAETGYYIISAYEGDDLRFIGISIPEKEYAAFDKMTEDTYAYYSGEIDDTNMARVRKTGRLKKMNKEMQQYYYEWFEAAEWYDSEAEMKEEALAYYIDTIADPMGTVKVFGFGIVAILVGGVIFLLGFLKERSKVEKSEAQSYVVINGVSYPKQTFAHVNSCILGQEKIFAAQEIAEITGLSIDEAGKIVEKWNQYYF